MAIKVSTHVEKEFGVKLRYHELVKLSERSITHKKKVYETYGGAKTVTLTNEDGLIESISTNNYVLAIKREGNKPGTYCHFFQSTSLQDSVISDDNYYFNVCHDGTCTFIAIRKDVEDVLGTLKDAFEWLAVPKEVMVKFLAEFLLLKDEFDIPELIDWVNRSSQESIDSIKKSVVKFG